MCRAFSPQALLPHEVEAGGLVEDLTGQVNQAVGVVAERGEDALLLAGRADDAGFAVDADGAGGVDERDAEAADFVDEAEPDGLLASPDLTGGERSDGVVRGVAAGSDVVDELGVHVVDE